MNGVWYLWDATNRRPVGIGMNRTLVAFDSRAEVEEYLDKIGPDSGLQPRFMGRLSYLLEVLRGG